MTIGKYKKVQAIGVLDLHHCVVNVTYEMVTISLGLGTNTMQLASEKDHGLG